MKSIFPVFRNKKVVTVEVKKEDPILVKDKKEEELKKSLLETEILKLKRTVSWCRREKEMLEYQLEELRKTVDKNGKNRYELERELRRLNDRILDAKQIVEIDGDRAFKINFLQSEVARLEEEVAYLKEKKARSPVFFRNLKNVDSIQHALAILGIQNPTQWRVSYKKLAAKYHPDRGGDPQKMVQLNQAKDFVLKTLRGQ